MMRRPFSPISSTDSSRSNATNVLDELNRKQQQHSEIVQKTLSTPVKTIPIPNPNVEEENRTPMAMPIPIPSTPSTVSIPMQTAITPAPLSVVPYNAAKAIEEMSEEIEVCILTLSFVGSEFGLVGSEYGVGLVKPILLASFICTLSDCLRH
nr:65-kDa microtubule-associated protein 3-like [Ipomoea batatas]